MNLPFTVDEFFGVFGRYNAAIWPAQIAGYALGIAAFIAAWRGGRRASAFVACALAIFWAVAGGGYHLGFFVAINPVGAAGLSSEQRGIARPPSRPCSPATRRSCTRRSTSQPGTPWRLRPSSAWHPAR
jgi:hypothetical protein